MKKEEEGTYFKSACDSRLKDALVRREQKYSLEKIARVLDVSLEDIWKWKDGSVPGLSHDLIDYHLKKIDIHFPLPTDPRK